LELRVSTQEPALSDSLLKKQLNLESKIFSLAWLIEEDSMLYIAFSKSRLNKFSKNSSKKVHLKIAVNLQEM
jgi:hypothetical protein